MIKWLKHLIATWKFRNSPYCYAIVKTISNYGLKIKACKYYKHLIDISGVCILYNKDVMDQCKECHWNIKPSEWSK
jgi:hypothetical protein